VTFSARRGKRERASCKLVNPHALGGDPLVIKGRGGRRRPVPNDHASADRLRTRATRQLRRHGQLISSVKLDRVVAAM